jgi:flavin-dependent dehydrogenase
VAVLDDLNLRPKGTVECRDMVVVGPTGRKVRLPCPAGTSYPSTILAVPRTIFDAQLRDAALEAGAEPVYGVARGLEDRGVVLTNGDVVEGGVVVGADGAGSVVAREAGLVDQRVVLRAFAVRAYLSESVAEPHIVFWEPERRRAFPGYGWIFPGPDGRANVGLGAAAAASARPARELTPLLDYLRRIGVLGSRDAPEAVSGGWLKMGMIGTVPAAGRVLLAGDAAGLVNPLQGEGISEALASGRAAAEAILGPRDHVATYTRFLAETYGPFQSVGAAMQRLVSERPRAVAALSRALVSASRIGAVAGGWSVFWNDLLDGTTPGTERTLAALALRAARVVAGRERSWLARTACSVLAGDRP